MEGSTQDHAQGLPGAPLAGAADAGSPFVRAARLGLGQGLARALSRRALGAPLLALLLAAVGALVERRTSVAGAVDRALFAVFGLVVPLAAFAETRIVLGREKLRDGLWPLARHGPSRAGLALGRVAAALALSSLLAALLGVTAVLVAHGPGARPLSVELPITAAIGLAAGAAYAGLFALGATFLRRGRGRYVLLAADLLLGHALGASLLVLPHAHATSLLGGEPVGDLGQPASMLALVSMALLGLALATFRSRD